MTQQQKIAANPAHSVWVAANAGSGKTKVLTDRVLRLLLQGVPPHRILCLTYTNAAAAEMALRVQEKLREWVTLSETVLSSAIHNLTSETVTEKQILRARKLFAQVVDNPEGVRIQTIHSLCQSLLRRFAIEAGVSPHFRLMGDQETQGLLKEAQDRFYASQLGDAEGTAMKQAVRLAASYLSESVISDLLREIVSDRAALSKVIARGQQDYISRLTAALQVENFEMGEAELAQRHFVYTEAALQDLRRLLSHLVTSKAPTDQKLAKALEAWLHAECAADNIDTWLAAMLTQKNEPRSCKAGQILTKAVLTNCPDALDIAAREVQHAMVFWQRRAALRMAKMSEAAWHIASGFIAHYHMLKNQRGLLDYEDLISLTAELLAKPSIAPWILYKLDGGIDHLLVDEAQDTSRIQWQLIDALATEFFVGESAVESHRTLFVVGDEKQSIYSFQGAEPAAFAEMKQHFATQIKAAEKQYEAVNLSLSFRSTQAVLQAVDAVFADPETQKGVAITEPRIMHSAHRTVAGKVELWPLIQGEESDEREAYTIPDRSTIPQLPEKLLAEKMAETIQRWLREKRILKGKNRPVHAGDIMVLVRRRGAFFNFLITELKKRNIPLAGADRMNLSDHIAVQDILALAQFLLLPEDNLNLACLLKSPLFGFSDEQLYQVCQPRPHKSTVWNELRNQTEPFFIAAKTTLEHWLNKVDYLPPYEMLSLVLEAEGGRQQFASRMGEEVHDPLTELLALALDYEQLHQPSLQGFLHWFGQSKIEIKRDLEQSQQKVRILTVHGSKGLEAPIVFLPDTTTKPDEKERLIWNTDESLFFWNYSSPDAPEMVKTYRAHHNEKAMEEYRRLLYVAMTRAADELYIAGWRGKRDNVNDHCWYRLAERGLRTIATAKNIEWQSEMQEMLVLENEDASLEASQANEQKITPEISKIPLPAWVKTAPENEPFPPRPLIPSRPEMAEPATESPTLHPSNYQRGQAVHSLLEILPDMPEAQRHTAAKMLLTRHWPEATEAEAAQVVQEVLAILVHPEFAPVFAVGSQAEVPLTAMITQEGIPRILSGQIDRLCITPTEILVVDYKTNRNIPTAQENIPIYYRKQLEGYAAALSKIYPQHTIQTAILWTSAPLLMPVVL